GIRDTVVGNLLQDSDDFHFQWMTKKEAEKEINDGKATTGVEMRQNGFTILVGAQSGWTELIHQTLNKAYKRKMQFDQITTKLQYAEGTNGEQDVQSIVDQPAFTLKEKTFSGEDTLVHDQTYQALFGFALFFVIFTIASNVFHILDEKEDGIWDRLILSPIKKWEMYAGNLVYSFLVGYSQIIIVFIVFRYIAGTDFGGNLVSILLMLAPYVLAIVSLCILMTGLVKTGQQYNMVTSFAAIALATIGGAFWPLEAVESEWMLLLSKLDPVMYGMDVANGAVYGSSFSELLYPISILLLMGVAFTGIGIHLMEKRHV
ncbi:MAG TPA: ABC transporter permease, partial [Bacillota bacterium]|nr:ABC transporter permease [Bacillota bacterium]